MRILIALALVASLHAQSWSGILNASRAINWQRANVGVSGGIPTNYTQCGSTIAAYSGAPTTINNAITACGANQYVLLGPGTFTLNASITFTNKSTVILRGSGPKSTKLVFTGAGAGGIFSAPVFVTNSPGLNVDSANVYPGQANACAWTMGFAQGATTITLTGCGSTGIVNGDIITLDQQNDTTDTGGVMTCDLTSVPGALACSATGQNANNTGRWISGNASTGVKVTNPCSTCISWAQMQHVKVTAGCSSACTGAGPFTLTISPGLYANNWGHLGAGTTGAYFLKPVNHVGVENLLIDATSCPNDASCQSGITFFDCDQCWRKNVVTVTTRRNHTWFINSTRGEVRDSYMFGVKNSASQSYGVENAPCDDCLIENNICQQVSSCFMAAGEPGTVWGYNFSINHPVGGGFTYMQADYLSHSDDDYMALYEGNQIGGLFSDQLHGTSNVQTIFRNRIVGQDYNLFCPGGSTQLPGPNQCPTNQTFPLDFDAYNRAYNVVGNVLGLAGLHTMYQAVAPTAVTRANCNLMIYEMGYGGGICDSDPAAGVADDSLVGSLLFRWGNYDVVNGAARFNGAESTVGSVFGLSAISTPASHTLPASFYLGSRPSFFTTIGSTAPPYPPIGPDVTGGNGPGGFSYDIPAKLCYTNVMGGPTDGSGGVLAFDANLCYNTSGTQPPTNLRVLVATQRQIGLEFSVQDATMATVDVYTDSAMMNEIPDTNGNNAANRSGSVVNGMVSTGSATGTDVQFVIGHLADVNALRAGTQYYVLITNLIDGSTATLQVGTPPTSTGSLYPEQPLADAAKWDQRSYPKSILTSANRNKAYTDPTTGLIAKPFSLPGDAWSQEAGTNDGFNQCASMCTTTVIPFDNPIVNTGTWTNPNNAASSYNVTLYPTAPMSGYATCTGTCDMWLPLPTLVAPSGSSWDAGTGSVYSANPGMDFFVPVVFASITSGSPNMQLSLTQTPTAAAYHGCTIATAPLTSTNTGYKSADPDPGFASLCAFPPLKGDMVVSTGTVNTSGTAVTWMSGDYFQATWPVGSYLIIGSGTCTIAAVVSAQSITCTATQGTQTGAAYASRVMGLRIQVTAGAGTLSVQAGYRYGSSPQLQVGETQGAGQQQCNANPNTISNDASGTAYVGYTLQGYICWLDYDGNSNGLYYLLIPKDQFGTPLGEVRMLGVTEITRTFTSNGMTLNGASNNPVGNLFYAGPDPSDPNKWYVICNYGSNSCGPPGFGVALLLSAKFDTGIGGVCATPWKTWTGAQNYPIYGNNAQAGNSVVYNDSCITYTNLTNPSSNLDVRSQIAANYVGVDLGGFNLGQIIYGSGTGFVTCLAPGGDPQPGVCGVFNTSGILTQAFDTFSVYPGRWGAQHGHPQPVGSWYSMTMDFTGTGNTAIPLFGPWQMQPTRVNLAGFGASPNWTTTTTLDNGTTNQYACPSSAQMQSLGVGSALANALVALGSSGNHCIELEVTSEACSHTPSTTTIWAGNTKTEVQQFPCPNNASWSSLQTFQPGDGFMDSANGNGGEPMIILTKQITSPGGICTTGASNCVIDFWLIRGGGIWPQQQHPNYPTYNTHANSWTGQMAPLQLNTCTPLFSPATGSHAWTQGLNSLCASHGVNVVGSAAATPATAFIDTNTSANFDTQSTTSFPGAAMPLWGPGCATCAQPLFPAYGQNAISFQNGNLIQLYGDGLDLANPARSSVMFSRALNPSVGTGAETASGMGTSGYTLTLVGGKNQTYTLTDPYSAGAPNQKLTPLAGWAGHTMLQDYSGASSVLPDTGYGMCRALNANECVTGSSAGTTYVSVPSASGFTQGIIGQHTQNAPAVVNAGSALGMFQEVAYGGPPDPIGISQRTFGQGFTGLGRQWQFDEPKLDPTGTWYLATVQYKDGYNSGVWLFQRPLRMTDSVNRTGYVLTPFSLGGTSGDTIRIEFWYGENGGINGRAEHGFAPGAGGAPFSWQYESGTYAGCSSGCAVSVPLIAGRIAYASVHRKNGSSESAGPVSIIGLP